MIQRKAATCHQTESEYIRHLIQTAQADDQPSISEEMLARKLYALYVEQQADRNDFHRISQSLESELAKINSRYQHYYSDGINNVCQILINLIRTLSFELEARAVARSRYYYWQHVNIFKDSNILTNVPPKS